MAKRRSKTLAQQAKCYEVENELEMMKAMQESFIKGNPADFKDYYRELRKEDRRRFIGFLYNQSDEHDFYKMVDMLIFG